MSTTTLGVKSGNIIVPITNYTKKSKWLDISSYISISGSTTPSGRSISSITQAKAQFTSDSNGIWSMCLDAYIVLSDVVTDISFAIAGVSISTTALQVGAAYYENGTPFGTTSNTIEVLFPTTGRSNVIFTLPIILLSAEPTWTSLGTTAAAALENVAGVDLYLAPCAAGTEGIINNLSGNTTGNPIKGRTGGGTVAQWYVGEVRPFTNRSFTAPNGSWGSHASPLDTLTAGSWLIFIKVYVDGATSLTRVNTMICTNNNNDDSGSINVGYASNPSLLTASTDLTHTPLPIYYNTTGQAIYGKAWMTGNSVNVWFSGFSIRIA